MKKQTGGQTCIPFHLLIPAAGSGSRLGGEQSKQYTLLAGKPLLRHTLDRFTALQGLKSVRVIIAPEASPSLQEALRGLEGIESVSGGETRKESVYKGISVLSEANNEDIVLIHDAARPFVSAGDIKAVLEAAAKTGAATLCTPCFDTLTQDGAPLDRSKILAIQTPQAFRLDILRAAHEKFKYDDTFTDDAGMVAAAGHDVSYVPGGRENFKITTPEDMRMAEKILRAACETRTGMGFDVHAFDPSPAKAVRIGGIDIPHDKALAGHSDADVALHALTDALLGAIGSGDIGSHFPPSDPQWKDADSAVFLKAAADEIAGQNGEIVHADITVICEAPKIGPHREAMRNRIAGILDISPARISIKATTTEGLGFTGRKEGIASQAVATIRLPVKD